MFTSRDVKILTAASIAMIVTGSVWLFGAIPLVVIGVILLVLALNMDF